MVVVHCWPVTSVVNVLLLKPGSDADAGPATQSVALELVMRHLRASTYFLLAAATYCCGYQALLEAAASDDLFDLCCLYARVAVRNLAIIHAFYGGWHWFLYERAASVEALRGRKFNPANLEPDGTLNPAKGYDPRWCRRYATLGVLIESAYEVVVLRRWATGAAPMLTSFWAWPAWSVGWLVFVIYWSDFHFFFAHRLMHPYFGSQSRLARLDLGRFLYRHVHSLHHQSYNTGPWSGIAMHPVEHVIYFTRSLLPSLLLPQHPLHFLFSHYHVLVSPLPGHDGYAAPAGGSHFHYLHHSHFECNFGTPMVPLDRWFGSYEDGSRWAAKAKRHSQ